MVKGFRTGQGLQRTATIAFPEGDALHGLEIEVGLRVPVGVILAADRDVMGEGVRAFCEKVIAWNLLNENDEPAPVGEESFRRQFDIAEAAEIVRAWLEVVTQPSAPLGQLSRNGTSSAGRRTKKVGA